MDLTYSQVLTALKYPRGPWTIGEVEEADSRIERSKVEEPGRRSISMRSEDFLSLPCRRADDISYCVSDMRTNRSGIFTPRPIFQRIKDWIDKSNPSTYSFRASPDAQFRGSQVTTDPAGAKDHFTVFKLPSRER